MKPIIFLLTTLFLIQTVSFSQQNKILPDKMITKSEDILNAILQFHNTNKLNDPERTIVTTEVLDNGYVLESRIGQYWNGTDWENSSKDLFTYNTEGLKTEEVNQLWNNGSWENSRRFLTTYYLNELISLYDEQTWNGTTWENSYQYESLYNTENKLSEYNVYQWNGSVWENMYKTSYTYYTSGNLETIIDQQWNGTSWVNAYKYSYQYNTNDDVSERLTEQWIEGNWENSLNDVYTYDTQNQVSLIASYWWSESLWKESVEIYYEYDSMGNVTDKLVKFWESEILGLQNKYHTTYEYLPSTSLESKIENQEWNLQLMQWINTSKETKTYDGENKIENYLSEGWDGTNWIPGFQENYSYDENGNLDVLISQYWSGTEWVYSFKATYVWSFITSVETENSSSIPINYSLNQNYPNPFNPNTVISFSLPVAADVTIKLYNSLGEELSTLAQEKYNSGINYINFQAANYVSGVYFYSITARSDDNHVFEAVKKMIILK